MNNQLSVEFSLQPATGDDSSAGQWKTSIWIFGLNLSVDAWLIFDP
jgi:hypothetical protein